MAWSVAVGTTGYWETGEKHKCPVIATLRDGLSTGREVPSRNLLTVHVEYYTATRGSKRAVERPVNRRYVVAAMWFGTMRN